MTPRYISFVLAEGQAAHGEGLRHCTYSHHPLASPQPHGIPLEYSYNSEHPDRTGHQPDSLDIKPSDIMSELDTSPASCPSDTDDEHGRSSTGSAGSADTAATSVDSVHSAPYSEPEEIPSSIQSHVSDSKFTDPELWNRHIANRAQIPGSTGPTDAILPQVELVSSGEPGKNTNENSSPKTRTFIFGASVSHFDPGPDLPLTRWDTRTSLCLNKKDRNAGLNISNDPEFQAAYKVAVTCSDRFGRLNERMASAINNTNLCREDAYNRLEELMIHIRGQGTTQQLKRGYDVVENTIDQLIDEYWEKAIATNPSAAAKKVPGDTHRVSWTAVCRCPSDTDLPESGSRSEEVKIQGSL
jgi:hypothetical protein